MSYTDNRTIKLFEYNIYNFSHRSICPFIPLSIINPACAYEKVRGSLIWWWGGPTGLATTLL